MPTVFIVDGSNLLFEDRRYAGAGRLDRALTSLKATYPDDEIVAFVDASATVTAKKRGDDRELGRVRDRHRVQVTPPGVHGKADRYICDTAATLRDAGRAVRIVSGDSYKELQAEFPWLLENNRFLDGREVAGLWTWTDRNAVRAQRAKSQPQTSNTRKQPHASTRPTTAEPAADSRLRSQPHGGSQLAAVGVIGRHQEVFHIHDGGLRHRWFADGEWSPWHEMPLPSEAAPTAVAAGVHGDWVDLFIVTEAGELFHRYWEDGWSEWEDWGRGFNGSIAVSSLDAPHLEVWVQQENKLVHRWQWDGEWTADWYEFVE
ncbi:hypothetical protein [Microbacterium galbinum]|uniref:NYN domain-containing protein n=1 Tax=Microbacterium galbinum TaxID=2851646 RepID=A0ABY4IUJ0_9MICO|nr:hypothetical protein [Microbacterium galbinum]UPL15687.1 hypothetical protein KV396_14895 [Microbacterium galbinum]